MCLSCGCKQPNDAHHDSRNITLLDLASAADAANVPTLEAAHNILASLTVAPTSKDAGSGLVSCQVIKSSDELRYTLGLAYPAMKADVYRAGDGHRDFVSHEKLEETAWNWMRKHRDINLFHKDGTSGHGTVVESYIWRAPDWKIQSPVDNKSYVIKSGDWMMGAVWDDYGWTLIKSGLVNGWSPEGTARRSSPSSERLAQLRS